MLIFLKKIWSKRRVTHVGGHICTNFQPEKTNFVRNIRKKCNSMMESKKGCEIARKMSLYIRVHSSANNGLVLQYKPWTMVRYCVKASIVAFECYTFLRCHFYILIVQETLFNFLTFRTKCGRPRKGTFLLILAWSIL